jgi:hypothetical protein
VRYGLPDYRTSYAGIRDLEDYVYGVGGSLKHYKATSVQTERQMAEFFCEIFAEKMGCD